MIVPILDDESPCWQHLLPTWWMRPVIQLPMAFSIAGLVGEQFRPAVGGQPDGIVGLPVVVGHLRPSFCSLRSTTHANLMGVAVVTRGTTCLVMVTPS